jgi:predicted membrane-bound mannosyltransferase
MYSFVSYFERGTGTPEHTYPWFYYLKILFYYNSNGTVFCSEMLLLVAFNCSIIILFVQNPEKLSLFFLSFAISMLAVYSVIPYKTPWNILGLIPAMAVPGAAGLLSLYERIGQTRTRFFVQLAFAVLFVFQVHTLWQLNFEEADAPENPFTYGHARDDVKRIAQKLQQVSSGEMSKEMRIDVIALNSGYWPLPWYLRHFTQVAWWNTVPENIAATPVILITPDMEDKLITVLYKRTPLEKRELYLPLFERKMELRPGIMMNGYIKKSLWDRINTADRTGF